MPDRQKDSQESGDARAALEDARQRYLYDASTGIFTHKKGRRVGQRAGTETQYGYINIKLGGVPRRAHRVAWLMTFGAWPCGVIDHINRDRADNRIENLRVVEYAHNSHNAKKHRDTKSGFKGVSLSVSGHFYAEIMVRGRRIHLGTFETAHAAAIAYDVAAREHHGEFACTNAALGLVFGFAAAAA